MTFRESEYPPALPDRLGTRPRPLKIMEKSRQIGITFADAFDLRRAFEDRLLRIDTDPKLHAGLPGIKKLVTSAGNIRFAGESPDSHCDRFWAKALCQHAAKTRKEFFAYIVDDDEPWGRYHWTPASQFFR